MCAASKPCPECMQLAGIRDNSCCACSAACRNCLASVSAAPRACLALASCAAAPVPWSLPCGVACACNLTIMRFRTLTWTCLMQQWLGHFGRRTLSGIVSAFRACACAWYAEKDGQGTRYWLFGRCAPGSLPHDLATSHSIEEVETLWRRSWSAGPGVTGLRLGCENLHCEKKSQQPTAALLNKSVKPRDEHVTDTMLLHIYG
jgi:hypothetical protein